MYFESCFSQLSCSAVELPQVLLASCYEEWQLDALRGHMDKGLALTVDATGSVNASPLDASAGEKISHSLTVHSGR